MSNVIPDKITTRLPAYLSVLLLCACMSAPEVTPDHFYRLAETKSEVPLALSWPGINRVAVARPNASGLYQSRNLLYVSADKELELYRYNRHLWIAAPAQLIQEHMIRYLRSALKSQQVSEYQPGAPNDLLIKSRLVRFEQVLEASASFVLVVMELSWSASGENGMQHSQRYNLKLPLDAVDQYAVAGGLSEALAGIYLALLKDMDSKLQATRSMQSIFSKS